MAETAFAADPLELVSPPDDNRLWPLMVLGALLVAACSGGRSGAAPAGGSTTGVDDAVSRGSAPGGETGQIAAGFPFDQPAAGSYTTRAAARPAPELEIATTIDADGRLVMAARTLARMAAEGFDVSAAAIREALWWHGVPEAANEAAMFRKGTSKSLTAGVARWISGQEEGGADRFGVAVRESPDGVLEVVALTVKTPFELEPVRRRMKRPGRLALGGKLGGSYEEISVVVSSPAGETLEPPAKLKRGRFTSRFEATTDGVWQVEILGVGPRGPVTLANFPVYVGVEGPSGIDLRAPGELESGSLRELEALSFDAVNRERHKRGLEELERAEDLSEVARRYSEEMARTGVIAHVSPVSGSVADRVRAAGVKLLALSENLARAGTVAEVHDGLMRSPAHRANILGSEYREVGIGVAFHEDDGNTALIVTQVFGSRWKPVDPAKVARDVARAIARGREARGQKKLTDSRWLRKAARRAAGECFAGGQPSLDPPGSRFESVRVVRFKTNDPTSAVDQLEGLFRGDETHIGIGVSEGRDGETGNELVCVIALFGRR